jgi:C4-dicarboxylate-specific signal transduction histidine kinase
MRARLRTDIGELPRIRASEHQLVHLLLNLVVSALQGMPEGSADGELILRARGEPGRVVVEVAGGGGGVGRGARVRPFASRAASRRPGMETGLGLAICRRIAGDLGGTIACDGVTGRGTTLTVSLPAPP